MASTRTNNVGKTTETLSTTIGDTMTVSSGDVAVGTVTMIAGTIGLGCIIFDDAGTMGICINVALDSESEDTIYTFETSAVSPESTITTLLSAEY